MGSGLNNYAVSANVNVQLSQPAIQKQQPVPSQYTIGDPVVYDILVTLPEGVTQNMAVLDALPNGLGYVGNQIITTAADSGGLLSANFNGTLPTPTVSTTAGDGNDVQWTFGNTTTAADNITTNNSFVIRLTVFVKNLSTPLNQDGTILSNSASLSYTDPNTSSTVTRPGGTVQVEVIEPQITTTKSVAPTAAVQAGNTLIYTVRFANTGNSAAYDIVAKDTLAQGVAFTSLTKCVDQNSIAVPSTATDNGSTVTFQGDPAGSWDIPATNPDSYIECTYTATVLDSVIVDGNHTNVVDANWSSQEGMTNPNERTYDDTPGYTVDGDQDVDDAVFNVAAPTFVKSDNGVTTARIGDVINYTLSINSPLGTLQSLTVQDVLPAGLIYLGDAAINAVGRITPMPAPVHEHAQRRQRTREPDLELRQRRSLRQPDPDHLQRPCGRRSQDNVKDKVLVNNAGMTYTNVTGVPKTLTDSDDFTIVEPKMTIEKTIFQGSATPGATVTVRIEVKNVGTSTAYEVTMTDVLPAGLTYAGGLDCTLGVQDPAPNPCAESGGTITAQWSQFLADGTTAIIEFQATVDAGVSTRRPDREHGPGDRVLQPA